MTNLERYNYLDDLQKLVEGNASEPSKPNNSDSNRRNSSQTPQGENSFQPYNNQTQLLLFAGVAVLILFYLMNQKEHD